MFTNHQRLSGIDDHCHGLLLPFLFLCHLLFCHIFFLLLSPLQCRSNNNNLLNCLQCGRFQIRYTQPSRTTVHLQHPNEQNVDRMKEEEDTNGKQHKIERCKKGNFIKMPQSRSHFIVIDAAAAVADTASF